MDQLFMRHLRAISQDYPVVQLSRFSFICFLLTPDDVTDSPFYNFIIPTYIAFDDDSYPDLAPSVMMRKIWHPNVIYKQTESDRDHLVGDEFPRSLSVTNSISGQDSAYIKAVNNLEDSGIHILKGRRRLNITSRTPHNGSIVPDAATNTNNINNIKSINTDPQVQLKNDIIMLSSPSDDISLANTPASKKQPTVSLLKSVEHEFGNVCINLLHQTEWYSVRSIVPLIRTYLPNFLLSYNVNSPLNTEAALMLSGSNSRHRSIQSGAFEMKARDKLRSSQSNSWSLNAITGNRKSKDSRMRVSNPISSSSTSRARIISKTFVLRCYTRGIFSYQEILDKFGSEYMDPKLHVTPSIDRPQEAEAPPNDVTRSGKTDSSSTVATKAADCAAAGRNGDNILGKVEILYENLCYPFN